MRALKTDILIIGHPNPAQAPVGADFASNEQEARDLLQKQRYSVLVFATDLTPKAKLGAFLDFLDSHHKDALRVLIHPTTSRAPLAELTNRGHVFSIFASYDEPGLVDGIQNALEDVRLGQQNEELFQLVQDQNDRLRRMSIELEDRVQKRQAFLLNARQRLLTTNDRLTALHKALVAVHRASSVGEMERLLQEALAQALSLSWVRIQFHATTTSSLSRNDLTKLYAIFKADLNLHQTTSGEIYFARPTDQAFSKDEKSFLLQVTDAVELAVDRIGKLQLLENLKGQWQATFDAISHPLSLVDANYVIFRTNRAFAEQSGFNSERLVGRKCYETLFQRTTPCPGCTLGQQFRLQHVKTRAGSEFTYQVDSQPIRLDPSDLFVVMYRDITGQQRLERQILESAKLAELGTIGSSIAHEINNPLGGMLSFLQLMKMDLKGDESFYQDIVEMENGAKRCRDIVQNLLGFTRKSGSDEISTIDLRDVIERALKITELQTRSKGILVQANMPAQDCLIRGQGNLLSQALCNLLQNAIEAIQSRARTHTESFQGEIQVHLLADDSKFRIEMTDNGVGIPEEFLDQVMTPHYTTKDGSAPSGLGLTVASQIIKDHQGELEISSVPGRKTVAKISIPRPVF